jgi:hypothetical protein
MFTSRAELLDKGETTAEHLKHREEECERLDKDKANMDAEHGGLFRGLFKERPPPLQPVVDLDDGVMRCPICSWELDEEEVCAGCGYEYQGGSDGTDYTDEDSDPTGTENHDSIIDDEADVDNDDGFGDIEDDDEVWGTFALPGSFPRGLAAPNPSGIAWHDGFPPFYHPGAPWPPMGYGHAPPPGVILTDPSEYDEHYIDEENEYDEQDSFIDDEEHVDREDDGSQSENSTVMAPTWQTGNSRRPIILDETIISDEDEDEDEDEEEDEEDSVVRRPHRRPTANFVWDDDSEEEEEAEAEEDEMDEDEIRLMEPRGPWGIPVSHGDTYHDAPSSPTHTEDTDEGENPEIDPAPGRRRYQNVVEDSEESESSDSNSPPPRRRPAGSTGVTFGNAITIDDDSEEEQPVGPVRRQVQRRQPRYSPY